MSTPPHRSHGSRSKILVATWISFAIFQSVAIAQSPQLLELDTAGGSLSGLPIHWTETQAVLLEPDGRLHLFSQSEIAGHRLSSDVFVPERMTEARVRLQNELGPAFETIVAGPYVIAAPVGQVKRWRARFQALLAGYGRYFQVRGWQLQSPDFPLCVIVFQSRQQFLQYAARETRNLPAGAIGSYFPKSNRCILYQLPSSSGTDWSETEATIVHEAVHQLAYNTGLHERLFLNPLWCVEGLACVFEVPEVYDQRVSRSTLENRMNPSQLTTLRELLAQPTVAAGYVESLIAGDELFRSAPRESYALAWGMTFYLAERMPREYERLLQRQRNRGFGPYSAGERMQDFRSTIGVSPSMLVNQMQRLFAG